MGDVEVLYRPVGPTELDLIKKSGWKRFPPRLPDQPIFYPVREREYAERIARDWNVKASGAGYVTRFAVSRDYLCRFHPQEVGGSRHSEYWIPAEGLDEFNDNIVGRIELVDEFHEDISDWRKAYDLAEDRETIDAVQKATLTTADFGLVPEVALFGSDEWWKAIEDGRIPKREICGVIAKVFMSGHGDWPEFEIDADGEKTRWTRFGDQSLYREGREVKVEYVMQRAKKAWLGKHELENVLRIFVRANDTS